MHGVLPEHVPYFNCRTRRTQLPPAGGVSLLAASLPTIPDLGPNVPCGSFCVVSYRPSSQEVIHTVHCCKQLMRFDAIGALVQNGCLVFGETGEVGSSVAFHDLLGHHMAI